MRLLFVVNGAARRVRIPAVARALRDRWPADSIEILVDPLRGELRDRCAAMDAGGGEAVVAVGGDGTVNRVLNAVGLREIPIGVLPLGRANDFAAELRIPSDFEGACRVLERGATVRVDLLSVNGTLFATCGGTDAAAAVAGRAARWARSPGLAGLARYLGTGTYVAAAVRTLLAPLPDRSFRVEVARSVSEGRALALLVSNQSRFGRRFRASPHASNRDGVLDLCVLPRVAGGRGIAAALRCAWSGDLAGLDGARQIAGSEARIVASGPVRFFGDGEVLAEGREFRLRTHHRAAWVIAPAPASPSEPGPGPTSAPSPPEED